MAGIDKTYVNKSELIEAINWAKEVGEVTLENGYKFCPLDFIGAYNDKEGIVYDSNEYVLWNTPVWFDRWLWCNCPLSFVRSRLQEQYDSNSLRDFKSWVYERPVSRKQKYTFLKVPYGRYFKWLMNNARRNHRWHGKCKQALYTIHVKCPNEEFEREYDEQAKQWYPMFGMLPCYDDFVWQTYHKRIPSKKAIIRQLNKWDLPKGTIVTVKCIRYLDLDFKILVK